MIALATGSGAHVPTAGSYYVTLGVALAVSLVALYALVQFRRREWPDVEVVVALGAATTALTAGVRLIVVALTAQDLGPFIPEDRIFIPVAGLALILMSMREIVRVIRGEGDEGCEPPE